jgi:hypothetical protein
VERADHGYAKLPEAASAVVLRDQIDILRITVTDVHSHRQIEPADLVVQRVKIGVGDEAVSFNAAHEHATGAVLLAKLKLLE